MFFHSRPTMKLVHPQKKYKSYLLGSPFSHIQNLILAWPFLKDLENLLIWFLRSKKVSHHQNTFGNLDSLHADGCVFLKANQKTGNVFVRSENGLGEGILITCQYDEGAKESNTFGPLPLDFFT